MLAIVIVHNYLFVLPLSSISRTTQGSHNLSIDPSLTKRAAQIDSLHKWRLKLSLRKYRSSIMRVTLQISFRKNKPSKKLLVQLNLCFSKLINRKTFTILDIIRF